MIKAIVFDRDGVVTKNDKHYYVWNEEQLEYVDGIFENLKLLVQHGFELYMVSNQGGISKGLYTKPDVLQLNQAIFQELKKHEIEISEVLFCPHHSEIENCLCRKPKSILIEKLMAKHKLCKKNTFFIGDSDTDMQAAEKAGIQGIRISSNQNMKPFILSLLK